MMATTYKDTYLQPVEPVSPGEILREELEARNWTQEAFAEIIEKPLQAVNEIINGKKSITAETAKLFSAALGTSPELWLNLESNYKLMLKEMASREEAISRKAYLYSILPMSELLKRNWINQGNDIQELENNVCAFFGVNDVASVEPSISRLRIGKRKKPHLGAIISWLRKVDIEGAKLKTTPYRPADVVAVATSIANLSEDEDNGPQMAIKMLKEVGVRVILLGHLKGTYIDGATMVDETGQPTIGLSLRMKRLDNFWFTLLHELGHILLHFEHLTKHPIVDLEEDGWRNSQKRMEKEANSFARDVLIPPGIYKQYIKYCDGIFSKANILEFAESIKISPSIVVGRLQFEEKIGYDILRKLLGRIKLEAA